jgi:hypothetical protein
MCFFVEENLWWYGGVGSMTLGVTYRVSEEPYGFSRFYPGNNHYCDCKCLFYVLRRFIAVTATITTDSTISRLTTTTTTSIPSDTINYTRVAVTTTTTTTTTSFVE